MTIDFDKYVPDTFDKFLGNYRQINNLKSVLDNNHKGLIIITGPSGSGKTLLANLIMGTKRSRSIDEYPKTPEEMIETRKEGYFDVQSIKVITSIHLKDIPEEAKSRAILKIELSKPPVAVLSEYISTVCAHEGISVTKSGVSSICGVISPTVAHLQNNVNLVINETGSITDSTVNKVFGIPTIQNEVDFFKYLVKDDYVRYLSIVSDNFKTYNSIAGLRRVLSHGILLVNGVSELDATMEEREIILKVFSKMKESDLIWVLDKLGDVHSPVDLISLIYKHSALSSVSTSNEDMPSEDVVKSDDEISKESDVIKDSDMRTRGANMISESMSRSKLSTLLNGSQDETSSQ